MPEQLLTVLKICLLALLYLFFLRVLRAIWTEVREPALAPTGPTDGRRRRGRAAADESSAAPARPAVPRHLVPVEPDGVAISLAPEMTLGRAPTASVVVDDTYASAIHARIFRRPDGWYVEDKGSTNGTHLNRRPVKGVTPLAVGDRLTIGNHAWEIR